MAHEIDLNRIVSQLKTEADFVGLRYLSETTHERRFRNRALDRSLVSVDNGLMVEVMIDGHIGYAATSDFTFAGIQNAFTKAKNFTKLLSPKKAFTNGAHNRPPNKGQYFSGRKNNLDKLSLEEICQTLISACESLKVSSEVATCIASANIVEARQHYVSSSGADIFQDFLIFSSEFEATAKNDHEQQTRSDGGGRGRCFQIGPEVFSRHEIQKRCEKIGREAVELLHADDCPTEKMDLLLMPDQMMLQIHESIGHPLELDRILGDERNFAGWSFVQAEDFGQLQYGSKLMNVSFDPTVEHELASYAFDDSAHAAQKEFLIRDGVLLRGLGGLESQQRLSKTGVANFRSSTWSRAPIDRMANLNLEAGSSGLDEMISSIENGIMMSSNKSWSIDDYRRKFQFSCEYAKLIKDGKVVKTVKNPNYRGVTLPFWNSLKMVGDKNTLETFGTPTCGKGEPSQLIRVGHRSPACLFENIEVFGGYK